MRTWYGKADPLERATFRACLTGWALDAFDSQIFSLCLPAIMASFALSRTDAGLITSITLITTSVGGWLGGALSDRYGRLWALRWSILWFAAFAVLVAVAQTPTQLFFARALQGFGFGAEWATGAVLLTETVRPEVRGRALGAVQSGWAIGWGAAVLAFTALFSWFGEEAAWRLMFLLGVPPVFLALYLQRGLRETLEQSATRAEKTGILAGMVGVFGKGQLSRTLAAGLLGVGAHGGYYGLFTWLPTFLKDERGLPIIGTGAFLATIIAGFWTGCVTAGILSDRFGRRSTVAAFALGCIAMTLAYILLPFGNMQMLILGFPLGFAAAGIPASLGALFSELYPAGNRGAGVGFCYNFGRLAAAGFPFLIGKMGSSMPLGAAIAIDAAAAYGLVVIAVLLLPRPQSTPDRLAEATA